MVIKRISSNRPQPACTLSLMPLLLLPDFSSSFFLATKKRRFPGRRPNSTTLFFPFHIPRGQNLSCLNEMQSISRFFLPFLFVRAVFGMRSIRGRAFKRGGGRGRGKGTHVKKRSFSFAQGKPPSLLPPLPPPSLKLYLCALLKSFASPIHHGWRERLRVSVYARIDPTD